MSRGPPLQTTYSTLLYLAETTDAWGEAPPCRVTEGPASRRRSDEGPTTRASTIIGFENSISPPYSVEPASQRATSVCPAPLRSVVFIPPTPVWPSPQTRFRSVAHPPHYHAYSATPHPLPLPHMPDCLTFGRSCCCEGPTKYKRSPTSFRVQYRFPSPQTSNFEETLPETRHSAGSFFWFLFALHAFPRAPPMMLKAGCA